MNAPASRVSEAGTAGGATVVPGADAPPLAERAAEFATAYTRWIDLNTADGLTYPRLRLLGLLHCGGPAIMRELGDQLGLSARNMTALVDGLERDGLVQRTAHPTDRRAFLVEATPEGLTIADDLLRPALDAIGDVFEVLTPAEQSRLETMFVKLAAEIARRRADAV